MPRYDDGWWADRVHRHDKTTGYLLSEEDKVDVQRIVSSNISLTQALDEAQQVVNKTIRRRVKRKPRSRHG